MGSITEIPKKKGTSYRARVMDDMGKPIYETFQRKSDAKIWISKMESKKHDEGLDKIKRGVSFEEYANWWIKERSGKIAVRSLENWSSNLRLYILPKFKDKKIGSISYQDGIDFQEFLKTKSLSNKTINLIIKNFRQILLYATKGQGYRKQLQGNPFAGLEMLPEKEGSLAYWEKEEVRQFLEAMKDDFYYDLYVFALYTGARLGEIAGLKKSSIDFKAKRITFGSALKRENNEHVLGTTKTGKTRYFSINETLFIMLKKHCEKLDSTSFVFCNPDGSTIDLAHFSRTFNKAQKKAEIKNVIRFHDIRHTFATNYMMNGGDVFELKKLLGHSSIEMTEKYAHFSPGHLQKTSEVVDFLKKGNK